METRTGECTVTLPSPVLDHVVIDVRDRIDEAMRCFSALGYQLTPRGRHTLGSVDHLAMFATDYLELLGFPKDGETRPEITRFPAGLNGLVFKNRPSCIVKRRQQGSRFSRCNPSRGRFLSARRRAMRASARPGSTRTRSLFSRG
jgi:hypothetical protein